MKNLEGRGKKEDVTNNASEKLEGLHLPMSLQKVRVHMTLKNATINSAHAHIDALSMKQWVSCHLDHPDNQNFVNQTASMREFLSYSARGLTHWTAIFFICTQLPLQKFEQTSQRWARCN